MINPLNNLLTPNQISKRLKVSVFTVYRWIKSGKLKAIKITPRVFRINEEDLKDFIKKHRLRNKNKKNR